MNVSSRSSVCRSILLSRRRLLVALSSVARDHRLSLSPLVISVVVFYHSLVLSLPFVPPLDLVFLKVPFLCMSIIL